jgi:triosephosphate isomerase
VPDFLSLTTAQALLSNTCISYGAQDAFWEDRGAYTGEITPSVLREVGCRFAELGHAERRAIFGETDADVARKSAAAARNGLVPLVCIGERHADADFDQGVSTAVAECTVQIQAVLDAVPADTAIVFAYEPVWAIGQAQPASAEHVKAVIHRCRELVPSEREVRFLYGGSAQRGSFRHLAGELDGLFLGRFGQDVQALRDILKEVSDA